MTLMLGEEDEKEEIENKAQKYSNIQNTLEELKKEKDYWNNILRKIQVKTPVESMNIMLNGWAMYQTIVCRLYARTGYYQSGGAFGFRDQLQDALSTKYVDLCTLKEQILKHSKHQFEEGDVEHWWHDETRRGIRTRFSDDLLWLPYSVCEYIEFTGDYNILDEVTPYISGNPLSINEDEKYDLYTESEKQESIYKHCINAIEHSLQFGENGLPKIGSGDWNDGFSTVGNKGQGESVWLGFFLYNILDRFDKICEKVGKTEYIQKYEGIKEELKRALNTNGWDGRWYKRAFMDTKEILGSSDNEECKIDSIAQSWSVISNAGDNDKKYIAMESLENYLVNKEVGIIKLLDPPFENSSLEPGYIKAYLPGVRENGGQYTHAAIWAVYGCSNLLGRGGWTWYTGSSSWFYKAGIEYILGLKIEEGTLRIEPCIPKDWKEYKIRYEYKTSIYNIVVKNPNESETNSVKDFFVNGEKIEEKQVKLIDNGRINEIEVVLG